MLPETAGRGQHFQVRGHSFSLYGPTLSRPITFLSFYSCGKLACKRVCLRNFAIARKFVKYTPQQFSQIQQRLEKKTRLK